MTSFAVTCSCVLWISGISWAIVALFGLSLMTGWTIAAGLGILALVAVGVLSYEVRNAIDIPDDVDLEPVKWSGPRASFGSKATRVEATGWPTAADANPVMARTAEAPVPGYYGRHSGF
ncbi:MAG: hypothetical protein ACRCXD_11685 [Luteolibacter sp.]